MMRVIHPSLAPAPYHYLFHPSYSWLIALEDCTWVMDGALPFTKPIFVGRLKWYV